MDIPCTLIPDLISYGTPVCHNVYVGPILALTDSDAEGCVSCFNHGAGTVRNLNLSGLRLDLSVTTGILLAEKWLKDHKCFGILHDLYPEKVSLAAYRDILAQHLVQSAANTGTELQGVLGNWRAATTGEEHRWQIPNARGSNAYCRVHPTKGWLFQILAHQGVISSGPETGLRGRELAEVAATNAGYYCVRD